MPKILNYIKRVFFLMLVLFYFTIAEPGESGDDILIPDTDAAAPETGLMTGDSGVIAELGCVVFVVLVGCLAVKYRYH